MAVPAAVTPEATLLYRRLVVPHLFAILIGTLLSGVVFLQLIFYYSRATASPRRLERISVGVILVSSVALLACDWWSMFDLVIAHAAEPLYVMTFHTPDFLRVLLGAIGIAAAQVWFLDRAARIVHMARLFVITGALCLFAEFAAALSLTTIGLSTPGKPQYYTIMANLTITWFWLGAAVDVLATSVLCWKARQIFLRPSEGAVSPLKSLIRLTFATGFATSLLALAGGIVYLLTRHTSNAFIPFVDALPRLSVFSMLITVVNPTRESRRPDHSLEKGRSPGPIIVGLPKQRPASSLGVYSPTLEDCQEYDIDFSAFDRSSAASARPKRRGSITTTSAASDRYGWDTTTPRERKNPPRLTDIAHVSEIGSIGDLERALKFYKREDEDGRGLSPNLAAPPEKSLTATEPCSTRSPFALPTFRRPCCRKKSCANGVSVARMVTTEVEE